MKGDVHDIGKNIVGVVLACNNYDIIDLGVMVPAEKILARALEEKVDVIGLSGLITPSLDEMVHVAKEMERLGFTLPLLIGGATTSRVHTAVKVAPHYSHAVVHVNDASRAVPVVGSLVSDELRGKFADKISSEYAGLRELNKNAQSQNKYIPLADARANKWKIDVSENQVVKPGFLGNKTFDKYPLAEIAAYIDWTPFFHSWEMKGSYPKIFDDKERGVEARKLFDDARAMLKKIIAEKWLTAKGVIGLYPANAVNDDDIEIYRDESRSDAVYTLHTIRQQSKKAEGQKNIALADFIKPKPAPDYIGCFAVSTGFGIEKWISTFEKDNDDYSAILLKALADRLAEAFAELMHQRVRKEFWGYAKNETLVVDELINETYHGIRPAPGYPAQPDHTEKNTLWKLLDVEKNTGITLTESLAMYPTAAVSGLYFSHPQSHYFGIGKIAKDQVVDYARRKKMKVEEVERWLGQNVSY